MIKLVVSGGQSGADLGAWRAAKDCGIRCSGHMPRGFLTEDGPRPEYARLYGAREHESSEFPPRTEANVRDSDFTAWFGPTGSSGYHCTRKACERLGRPLWIVGEPTAIATPKDFRMFLERDGFEVMNCSGGRASRCEGIEDRVYRFLVRVFRGMNSD